MATPRSFGSSSWIALSPARMAPELTSSKPAIIRRLLVLPQPDEPSSATISPSLTVRSTLSTAVTGALPRLR